MSKKVEVEKAREGVVQSVDSGEWMRAKQLLKMIPISSRTLDRWKAQNRIPFVRAGERVCLFRRSDVERVLSGMTIREVKP